MQLNTNEPRWKETINACCNFSRWQNFCFFHTFEHLCNYLGEITLKKNCRLKHQLQLSFFTSKTDQIVNFIFKFQPNCIVSKFNYNPQYINQLNSYWPCSESFSVYQKSQIIRVATFLHKYSTDEVQSQVRVTSTKGHQPVQPVLEKHHQRVPIWSFWHYETFF